MKLSVAASSLLLTVTAGTVTVDAFQSSFHHSHVVVRSSSKTQKTQSLIPRSALAADPVATLEETFAKSPAQGGNNKDNSVSNDQNQPKKTEEMDMTGIAMSGLNGQALRWTDDDYPTALELRSVIPKDCFESDTKTSLGYLSVSVVGTALCTAIGISLLNVLPPENLLTAPFWFLYSGITGTVAMGLWVLAHECGHGAFSKNKTIQDTVGYVLHSLFLVPYYSWQRSHAVHHRYTNHMELGETHVPEPISINAKTTEGSIGLRTSLVSKVGSTVGMRVWGSFQTFIHLIIGWPAYLLIGATGGPDRGMTNHYWPDPLTEPKRPKMELFPGSWKEKVFKSDIGVAAVATGAIVWAICNGLPQMMALYGGPLIVVNAWLVLYTWLQHTDVDVPHYSDENHSFVKGALHTIDRPYDKLDPWGVIDFLHHKIGTTHVAHHFDSTIPHYKAQAATDAIKEKYPQMYLYDPTPIPQALWRIAKGCTAVEKRGDRWVWNNEGVMDRL